MANYEIRYSDRSHDCNGTLTTSILLSGLTQGQLDEISDAGGRAELDLSSQQVERNKAEGNLSPDELEMREDDGSLFQEVSAETICPGCGSDVSRNADGQVIPG